MKHTGLLSLAALAMLAGCTSDMEDVAVSGDKFAGHITLTSESYTFEDGTRTALTNTGSAIEFAWKNGEAIGVFPIAPTTNNQAKQVIETKGEGTSAVFDGAGWALLKGNTYAAYSPYQEKNFTDYTAVPVDMTGQKQTGNASLKHIGDSYDYMYANASIPTSGGVSLDFQHIGSIVMLELTMPENAQWTKATLTAESPVFVTSATMNVSDGTLANKQTSNSISLDLDNVSGKNLTLYLAALPTTTGSVTLKVKKSNNEEFTATLASKTLVAGHAYKWKYSWATEGYENGYKWVDLGLSVRWATMNVGATKPEGKGTYFAWGEVTGCEYINNTDCTPAIMDGNPNGWSAGVNSNYVSGGSKTNFASFNYYKWCKGSNRSITKYVTESFYGTVDNKTTLDPEDDAAHVNWGGDWRMPTKAEIMELRINCYWVWTSSYNGTGVPGFILYKALSDSDKGKKVFSGSSAKSDYTLSVNHIFLPASGDRDSSSFYNVGFWVEYWSSSLLESNSLVAWNLNFSGSGVGSYDYYGRYHGLSVRAVCR